MENIEENQLNILDNIRQRHFNKYLAQRRLRSEEYSYNITIVKNMNNRYLKLTRMSCCRNPGVEVIKKLSKKNSVNTTKLDENKLRAKNKIFELAFCNNWDWFFTATLDESKINYKRSELDKFHKSITQWIRNYNKKYDLDIKFLLVPELHKDRTNWHMHGLLKGLPIEHLKQFEIGDIMGKGLADKVLNGEKVYNWLEYKNKFGFCDLEPIKNHEAISNYMTKYITKELIESSLELGSHLYYHSRGLKVAEVIKKGHMSWGDIQPDFENEYCAIAKIPFGKKQNILNSFFD